MIETAAVKPIASDFTDGKALLRFASIDDQLLVQDLLSRNIGERYIVSLNLAPATPAWLRSIAQPMFLGLDLRGGVHFLMEIDMVAAIEQAEQSYADDFRATLRGEGIKYRGIRYTNSRLEIRFPRSSYP